MKYAATSTAASPALPSNLETTFYGGTANTYVNTAPVSPMKLHPFSAGYQAVAGDPAACKATDPGKWTASGSGSGSMVAGIRAPAIATTPGGSATLPVPMGVVNVKIPATASYITAVMQTGSAGSGYPGCATGKTYTFSTKYTAGSTVPIALPYGRWIVYTGGTLGATTTAQTSATMTVVDSVVSVVSGTLATGLVGNSTVNGSNVLTLDPRVKNP
jgi:hypothetical protein